ncbi:tetratricopeptide repeat protein [Sneathiella glossodoripedis]|uniref:tetratricopeptide repeat protein n=1 Tax=Sneathiella glossodoripedis TaxID=418853 RepID=UPI000472F1BF|nr:tetratricopeptide repeat protein [Sneathiella glossodoripedis]
MSQQIGRKLIRLAAGVGLLIGGGCSAVGPGTGRDYAPEVFMDEGGVSKDIPETLAGQYLAGRHALREEDTEQAYRFFYKAYSGNDQDALLRDYTFRSALANGNMQTALTLAQKILQEDNRDNEMARLVVILNAIKEGRTEEAYGELQKVDPRGINILLKPVLSAWVLLASSEQAAAIESLDQLDRYDGFKLLKSYHLALLAHQAGMVDLAAEQYEAALKGPSGQSVRLVQSYGTFLIETGRADDARKLFEDYKKRFPQSPTINKLLELVGDGKSINPLISNPLEGAAEALYSSAAIIGQEQASSTAITMAYFA